MTPPDSADESTADAETTTSTEVTCEEQLRGLANGDYGSWTGVSSGCTRETVEAALGSSTTFIDRNGSLGGALVPYREYAATPAAPTGLTVWFNDDAVALVRVRDPVQRTPIDDQLGPPETTAPSQMPGFKTQLIYASRGLTLHIDTGTDRIAWLYAYVPMTVDAYRNSWLNQVEVRRLRKR